MCDQRSESSPISDSPPVKDRPQTEMVKGSWHGLRGIIRPDHGGRDVLVHESAFLAAVIAAPRVGARLAYEIGEHFGRARAIRIRPISDEDDRVGLVLQRLMRR